MASAAYILLVEDNPGDARLTQALLSDLGGSGLPPLCWVQSAEEAVDMLARQPHCMAVLLDLGLPDSQGLQALHTVAQSNSALPIVVLTGDDSAPMGMDAVQSGAQDYLVKGSFDAPMLQRSIAFAAQRKRAELVLIEKSLHDELTGLPRRRLLLDRLDAALRQSVRTGAAGALIFIDLDHFKQVNDAHGHAAGDAVLRCMASRLLASVRASDTVARLGGDEFVVLLPTTPGPQDALAVGSKLLGTILEPVPFEALWLQVSASVGVAHFSPGQGSAEQLMKRADAAMYAAKAAGKGQVRLI